MANKWTAPLRERDITRQIAREFYQEFDGLIESDAIVVGAGPSGLLCARDLASEGYKTLLIEQSLFLGGGFWSGGYLMNKATICAPADKILNEFGIPAKRIKECEGMFMVDPPHATAKLIAAAYDAGVKVLNLTKVIDLVLRRENILEGVVVNWSPVEHAGHDAVHVVRARTWSHRHLRRGEVLLVGVHHLLCRGAPDAARRCDRTRHLDPVHSGSRHLERRQIADYAHR